VVVVVVDMLVVVVERVGSALERGYL